jgi:hypothetical protein
MHGYKSPVSHYDFIKQIALAWIEPDLYWPGWNGNDKKRRSCDVDKVSTLTSGGGSSVSTASRTRQRIVQQNDSSRSTKSSITTTDHGENEKAKRMNDNSLDPARGSLRMRLDCGLDHIPEIKKGTRARCQLHRWAIGRDAKGAEVRGNSIMKCQTCKVNLCSACWKIFHKKANILSEKANILKV